MSSRTGIFFKQLTSVLLVFLTLTTAHVCRSEDNFELGNKAYTEGDFSGAVQQYLAAATTRGASASLLYNMANAYAAMGKIGEAVRAYEQALRLDHGNSDIRSNLAIIRKKNGLYREDRPLWQKVPALLGANQWMLLSGLFFLIFSGTLLVRTLSRTGRTPSFRETMNRLTGYTAALALIGTLITLPAALHSYKSWNDGVVLSDSRLLISPFASAASGGTIREGRVVRPLRQHGDFILVVDTSGQKGWLDKKRLGFIRDLPGHERKNESQDS